MSTGLPGERLITLREVVSCIRYPGYLTGIPDLLVIQSTPTFRCPGAPESGAPGSGTQDSGARGIAFIETEDDQRFAEQIMDRPPGVCGRHDLPAAIGRMNSRRSTFPPMTDLGVLLYPPPSQAWPCLVVTMLQRNTPGCGAARDRYGWGGFETAELAQAHMMQIRTMAMKRSMSGARIRLVTPPGLFQRVLRMPMQRLP